MPRYIFQRPAVDIWDFISYRVDMLFVMEFMNEYIAELIVPQPLVDSGQEGGKQASGFERRRCPGQSSCSGCLSPS